MRKYIFLGLILILLLLNSCTVKYNEQEVLINDFYTQLTEINDRYDYDRKIYKKDLKIMGKYGEGYIIIEHVLYSELYFRTEIVEDVEINIPVDTLFYYYINNETGRDYIYYGLNNILNNGLINVDDLRDIANKFNIYKDSDKPYVIENHFPI